MALDPAGRRVFVRDDEVELTLDKKGAQIVDEGALFILGETRGRERCLEDVKGLLRLLSQFFPDGFCVLVPRREVATKGIQKHDALWLG